jgi:hypothetical protein
MKKEYPYAFSAINYYDKYLGTRESLIGIINLVKEKGYDSPDLIQIFANFSDGSKLIPKRQLSKEAKDSKSPIKEYEFISHKRLRALEKNIYKILDIQERYCWNCGVELEFQDYCKSNPQLTKARALDLWEHHSIEFYCCSCYKFVKNSLETERRLKRTQRTQRKIFEQLPQEAKEKIQFLEKDIGKKIPAVSEFIEETKPKNVGFIFKRERIIGLSLYYYGLTNLPETLKSFQDLEFLDLIGNKLEYLPEWIGNFKRLKYLNLLANHLESLPNSIGNLTHLEYFNLSFNQLTKLPQSIKNLTDLRTIYLWANKIENLLDFAPYFNKHGIYVVM